MAFVPILFLLSACGSGGILGNGSWQAGGLQNQSLRVLAVNAKNVQTLYVGNAQGHIFTSADAGQHWSERSAGLPLPNPIHALSFDDADQKLYAATEKGLFTTTADAAQWSVLTASGLPSAAFTALLFDPATPTRVYVGTANKGVYRSDNGGSSWQVAGQGLASGAEVTNLSYDPTQHQVWAATDAGAYRSDDRGASWRSFSNGLSTGVTINKIVSTSSVGGTDGLVYMGTNHGIYLSRDAGAHWSAPKEALPGTGIHDILLDFRSANVTLNIATDVGVFRSADNGQSWSTIASDLPRNVPTYALALGSDNYAQLYAAGSGIYLFPGTGSGIAPTRILPLILVVAFFALLYWLSQRGRRRRRIVTAPVQESERPKVDDPPATSV